MLSPLIRRAGKHKSSDPHSQEHGVTLALVAVALVAIIAMAALSIDIGTLYTAKTEAQRAADAAALAAARVISMSGITGDPGNTSGDWVLICGPDGSATHAATAVAQVQWNFVGGVQATNITVTYGSGTGSPDCSTLAGTGSSFSVNPIVTVKVQQPNLPTFFGRIFALIPGGTSSNSGVSATATAEVYNPSGSAAFVASGVVPVQPRCVKPWIVPDNDPIHTTCSANGCKFVNPDGTIVSPGITVGGAAGGVIGEQFTLVPDCNTTGLCNSATPPFNAIAQSNVVTAPPSIPNLQYLPALVQNPSPAAPGCAAANDYQQAIAGCDNTTPYQCGVPFGGTSSTQVDLNENPYGGGGDTSVGAQCLIRASGTGLSNGQDSLVTASFPFQVQSGTANPISLSGVASGSAISSSTSIVTLPIYDSSGLLPAGQTPFVTIIGFLQVFINQVNADGSLNVTVLNVSGCSNTSTSTSPFVTGTSPVPIRLITPPTP
jgi:Flp pilus assembly protein TadG